MPGILDYNKILDGYGPYSTEEYRNFILDRNLPQPVSQTLIEGGLTTYLQDINKIISIPANPASENIPIHYDENQKLFPLGVFYRDTQNVNLNTFSPQNDEYVPFNIVVPPNLGTPIPSWGGEKVKTSYPAFYNEDNFDLVNKGDKKGIQNPYIIVDNYRNLNLNKESSIALLGGESLEQNIISKVSQVEMKQTSTITTGLQSKDNFINWMRGSQEIFNTLSNDSVGWQEYNSNNRDNAIAGQLQQINNDLGNNVNPSLSTEQRVNSLLTQTDDTQVGFLLNALNQNLFKPLYSDSRLQGTSGEGTNSRYYIGSERSTNRGATIPTLFQSSEFNGADGDDPNSQKTTTIDENYFWETGNQTTFNEKTLLYKTQKLLDEHPDGVWINQTKKYFKDKNQDRLISRGSAISKLSLLEAAANGAFCRVWTVNDNYNYLNAIRNTGLFSSPDSTLPGFSVSQENASLSVLMDNGLPKYHPVAEDSTTTFKKFMLSLENLAWSDNLADLPLCEIGPGDLLSGNKGRIMWFPPYDLSFDESVSSNWQKNDFLGRSEPVYTYNNTTRSGSLKFKVLVDHPKVINGYRGKRTNAIERFLAGCITPTDFLEFLDKNSGVSQAQKNEIELKLKQLKSQQANAVSAPSSKKVEIFWGDGKVTGDTSSKITEIKNAAQDIISQQQKVTIIIESYEGVNEGTNLSRKRSKFVEGEIEEEFKFPTVIKKANYEIKIKNKGSGLSSGVSSNNTTPQADRRTEVTIEPNIIDGGEQYKSKPQENLKDIAYYPEEAQIIDSLIIDEAKYFDFVDANFPNYFTSISEKIKYFHPGFHSTTPEGLNTRLTFLQQCMRQGPSIYDDRNIIQPQNLAFGRPPICILRIGDFFHTKVAINSLNITYEAGSAIQWDLNPSGIGVQPMMANVTMSLDILGGQSLVSPINRLQNALSFNFYANTEMYDARADSVNKSTGKIEPGLKLGQLKYDADVDIETLEESLKTEGIINQTEDNKNTGDNTNTPSTGDFIINGTGETQKITVSAPQSDANNLTRVIISKKENNTFTEIINSLSDETQLTFDVSNDLTKVTKNLIEIGILEKNNIQLNDQINALKNSNNNLSIVIPKINIKERKIEKNNEEIKILEKTNENINQIKVKVYYDDNEDGSTQMKSLSLDSDLKLQ